MKSDLSSLRAEIKNLDRQLAEYKKIAAKNAAIANDRALVIARMSTEIQRLKSMLIPPVPPHLPAPARAVIASAVAADLGKPKPQNVWFIVEK